MTEPAGSRCSAEAMSGIARLAIKAGYPVAIPDVGDTEDIALITELVIA